MEAFPSDHITYPKAVNVDFAAQYFQTRLKEERILSDQEVRQLPSVPVSNTHFKEWKLREINREFYSLLRKQKAAVKNFGGGLWKWLVERYNG